MGTDSEVALRKYRLHASRYDHDVQRGEVIRRATISRLGLKPGDVVFDVACGTGLSFPLIEDGIGTSGRLIGIEMSPDMLAEAGRRIENHGWNNVTLINSPVETASIPVKADAVLFSFTHDVLRSPGALANVCRQIKPGARVAASGTKWAPWWAIPVNVVVWYFARKYVTTFEGFGQPWSHLIRHVPDFRTQSEFYGAVYVGWGTAAGDLGG